MPSYSFVKLTGVKPSEHVFMAPLSTDSPNVVSALSEGQKISSFIKIGSRPSGFKAYDYFLQREDISLAEKVQSVIPVLEWQTGYSYYNNYSSKPEEVPIEDKLNQDDSIVFVQEVYILEKNKLITKSDEAVMADSGVVLGGIRPKYYADTISMNETVARRNGLWSFSSSETITESESAFRKGIWVVTPLVQYYNPSKGWYYEYDYTRESFKETITHSDKHTIGLKFSNPENIGLEDYTYRQNGTKAIYRSDTITLIETHKINNKYASDNIVMYENKILEGLSSKAQSETITFQDNYYDQTGRRIWLQQDTVTMVDSALEIRGKRSIRQREDWTVTEAAPPFLRTVRDDFSVLDEYYSQNGKRHWIVQEVVNFTDRIINETPQRREDFTVSDSFYKQGGIRLWQFQDSAQMKDSGWMATSSPKRLDTIAVTETYSRSGIRTFQLGDTPTEAQDSGWMTVLTPRGVDTVTASETYLRNGILALAKYTETVTLQDQNFRPVVLKNLLRSEEVILAAEEVQLHGKIVKRANDTVQMYDSKFFNIITERDEFRLEDRYPPFRFDWRDNYSLKNEWYYTQKYKDYYRQDYIEMSDRGALNDKFVVDILYDETITYSEKYIAGGITAKKRTEQFSVNSNYYKPISASPLRSDGVAFSETYRRNGLLSIPTVPSEQISSSESWATHGRRAWRVYDGGMMQDGSNRPYSPRGYDTFYAQDSYFFMPTREDYFVMKETWAIEDITQVIKMVDSYYLSNKEWTRRENFSMQETRDNKSGLTLGDKYRFSEKKLNERIMINPRVTTVTFTDKHKLFRKSDFLDINPVIYRERPGRLRSAVRLVTTPDGQLYGVWADREQHQIIYARKPYPDSWRGHVRIPVDLPVMFPERRTVTLAFPDGVTPTPMIESAGQVLIYRNDNWEVLDYGYDVATHPITGEWVYITPDRLTIKIGTNTQINLSTRGRIVQSYTGSDPGLYVVDDLNRLIYTIGIPPAKQTEPAEEVASTRWDVLYDGETFTRAWIPVEGVITQGRI